MGFVVYKRKMTLVSPIFLPRTVTADAHPQAERESEIKKALQQLLPLSSCACGITCRYTVQLPVCLFFLCFMIPGGTWEYLLHSNSQVSGQWATTFPLFVINNGSYFMLISHVLPTGRQAGSAAVGHEPHVRDGRSPSFFKLRWASYQLPIPKLCNIVTSTISGETFTAVSQYDSDMHGSHRSGCWKVCWVSVGRAGVV